jgi:hypothetical protein
MLSFNMPENHFFRIDSFSLSCQKELGRSDLTVSSCHVALMSRTKFRRNFCQSPRESVSHAALIGHYFIPWVRGDEFNRIPTKPLSEVGYVSLMTTASSEGRVSGIWIVKPSGVHSQRSDADDPSSSTLCSVPPGSGVSR